MIAAIIPKINAPATLPMIKPVDEPTVEVVPETESVPPNALLLEVDKDLP